MYSKFPLGFVYSKFPLAIQPEPFSRIVRQYNNAGELGRAGVSINSPAAANTSLLVSIV